MGYTIANTTTEKARIFVDNFSNTQGVTNGLSGRTTRFNHFSLLSAQGDVIFLQKAPIGTVFIYYTHKSKIEGIF